jgi:hypothetical protein
MEEAVAQAPGETVAQRLRLDATLVEWLMAYPSRWPDRWAAPEFRRQVDLVRRHLEPIRSLPLLFSSFEREGMRTAWPSSTPPENRATGGGLAVARSPVKVAYAIRWIELTSGHRLDIWD